MCVCVQYPYFEADVLGNVLYPDAVQVRRTQGVMVLNLFCGMHPGGDGFEFVPGVHPGGDGFEFVPWRAPRG